jgi:hypothetical protein
MIPRPPTFAERCAAVAGVSLWCDCVHPEPTTATFFGITVGDCAQCKRSIRSTDAGTVLS